MKKNSICTAALVVFALVAGCHPKYIPNTEIEDNQRNQDIVAFCERYRHGVEDMNVGLLLTLLSPRYFDNSGTPDASDDLDRTGIEAVLKDRLSSVKSVRYEIRYRNIYEVDNVIYVEIVYTMSYQYTIDTETKWANKTADNRFAIEATKDGFLFLSGV